MEPKRTFSLTSDAEQSTLKYTSNSNKKSLKVQEPLEKIEENEMIASQSSIYNCFKGNFGVRSYLNEFYERNRKDSDQNEAFIDTNSKKKCSFRGFLWNLSLVLGITCVFIGLIGLIIGHIYEEERILSITDDGLKIINKNSQEFNYHLDICKLVGLLLIIFGGLLLAISLIAQTFSFYDTRHDQDLDLKETFHLSTSFDESMYEKVPISSILKSIQPSSGYSASLYPPISIS
jgi:hypothetical protein